MSPALAAVFQEFWVAHRDRPMLGRNKILAGVCPGVAGMLPAKLAALLVLIGGVSRRDEGGTRIRGDLHLLLVGDPGTGKSQLMKWACRACPGRAVLTTGRGSSGAGLTVSAVRDGNSWALEAGALVLADGGLCCIDEFDGIRPTERAVIHEAGLVTNLSTRTAIIGAINPRPGTTITCARPLTEVTGLEGPLLSRFDLVLMLADPRKPDWDRVVAGHVLARGALAAEGQQAEAAEPQPRLEGPGDLLALPPAEALMAPLPPLQLVQDGSLSQTTTASQDLAASAQGSGRLDESRLTIAQRVAARLNGGVTGTVLPLGQPPRSGNCGTTSQLESAGRPTSALSHLHGEVGKSGPQSSGDSEGGFKRAGSAWTLDIIRLSTIRALESLIRLSQAHARLLCSDQVLLRDAIVAVALVDTSLQLLHIPGSDAVACTRSPEEPDDELLMQQRIVMAGLGLTCLLPAPPFVAL
ncbi:hypothetical protein GPECTOR_7g1353 [Gonium pectorale]|uniref:DNA helicase n=1 Tax=Gonium pectorale TaxID=33097 RepID=A0A150GUI8_GONPE|nr:hypothetical protein GPECTOR_7g1353 [Gonium pectorale]|eukprot:KXZ53454.1 hypothetical protein GPECTOR_7g1353 [Gonium pectorale]